MHRRAFGLVGLRALGLLIVGALLVPIAARAEEDGTPFGAAIRNAEAALADGNSKLAAHHIGRALERDPKSPRAWALRARWAGAAGELDEQIYALHRHLDLRIAQGFQRKEVGRLRDELAALDPVAADLLSLRKKFTKQLMALATGYEKGKRPHSAIRAYQQVLALNPERADVVEAIERISAAPDPSLAGTAREKDLLADVSETWIREHDAKHGTWETRAKIERENYITHTDAGYAVAIRTAEAMEQMNAFYRIFFQYGTEEHGGSVPRIAVHIFKNRDEYLTLGKGPPVKWSGGHFTGGSVETYIGDSGFDGMTGTLFHEAAHQFVSLATNAAGWLNEGLASFFEGTKMLPNGTVVMNLPADHRLFPLASRMERGWMESATDGIDPAEPSASSPQKAPSFRIVLENEYAWGPPWYAPTWGVVYFLHNFQDPLDGRFVYREAFREYIDASGGKTGKGAIKTFEEVLLGQPAPLTPGLKRADGAPLVLPKTVDELNEVWKTWILRLRDEQQGTVDVERPYAEWAQHAITRKDYVDATEHFEQGLLRSPHDVELLVAFADHLASREKNTDRATKLVEQAIRAVESHKDADPEEIDALESRLVKWDSKRAGFKRLMERLRVAGTSIVERYRDADQPLMTMYVSWRLGSSLRIPGMLSYFEEAVRASGKTLSLWSLAYNERDLRGWSPESSRVFQAYGTLLRSSFGTYTPDAWDFNILTLDTPTAGDFSFEAEVLASEGENAFSGLVFGRKSATTFHSIVFFPRGSVDLVSFYGAGNYRTWRSGSVVAAAGVWQTLRVDVVGQTVDVWANDELVVTQEFPSADVLRGSFGLITGRGRAQFRNVRFLAREAGDPGAAVERKLKLAALENEDGAIAGSYQGQVPPFPTVSSWVQGERASWADSGEYGPQLLVFWSRKQNDVIAIDGWLRDLEKRYAGIGLGIVALAQNESVDDVISYLERHPLPGTVGVDHIDPKKGGYGTTFDAYFVGERFRLPRVVLLDVDQSVVWEGNSGFTAAAPWKPGAASPVDAVIADIAEQRALAAVRPWRAEWLRSGPEALREGRFADAAKLISSCADLPPDSAPEVTAAQSAATIVSTSIEDLNGTARAFVADGTEAALTTLLAWGESIGRKPSKRAARVLNKPLASPNAKAWSRAVALAAKTEAALTGEDADEEALRALVTALEALPGTLVTRATKSIRLPLAAGVLDSARAAVTDLPNTPARWLAEEHFRFD